MLNKVLAAFYLGARKNSNGVLVGYPTWITSTYNVVVFLSLFVAVGLTIKYRSYYPYVMPVVVFALGRLFVTSTLKPTRRVVMEQKSKAEIAAAFLLLLILGLILYRSTVVP